MGFVCETIFWNELLPFCFKVPSNGWLADDHINAWTELLILQRPHGARLTVAKSTVASYSPGTSVFLLVTDNALQGTLSGRTRPYPSWDEVDVVYMPIHAEGNHWVLAVVNLQNSHISVFDSMHSDIRPDKLRRHIVAWTKFLNESLEIQGYFEVTRRQHVNFSFSYNDSNWFPAPQQENCKDCGVITCWLMLQFCKGRIPPPVINNPSQFFREFRLVMANHFYGTRCEDTSGCRYD